MIEKKENVVVKTAMKRKWSLLLTVLLDVAGTAGTIAVYYFIYKVIAEIVDKHAMVGASESKNTEMIVTAPANTMVLSSSRPIGRRWNRLV